MKIAFVLTDLSGGGAEKVFVDLANEAVDENYEVYLFIGRYEGVYAKNIKSGVKVFELGSKSSIRSFPKLVFMAKKYKIEKMYGTLNMAYAVALSKIFLRDSCVCVSRLGNTLSSDLSRFRLIKRIMHRGYVNVIYLSDYIVSQSQYMREDLTGFFYGNLFKHKLVVIYNPLKSVGAGVSLKPPKELQEWNNRNSFKFLAVGRLEVQKDYPTLISAFKKLSDTEGGVVLHILGDGSLRHDLERLVACLDLQEKIFFEGFVDDVESFMQICDAFVLTSLYEGFSNALLQAVGFGLPVVATDSPSGNSELLAEYGNGFLVPVGDVESISHAMKKCMTLSKNDSFDSTAFSPDAILQQYLTLGG